MAVHDLSFQCLLQQDSTRIVAWIEARGAAKGARVEIEGPTVGGVGSRARTVLVRIQPRAPTG